MKPPTEFQQSFGDHGEFALGDVRGFRRWRLSDATATKLTGERSFDWKAGTNTAVCRRYGSGLWGCTGPNVYTPAAVRRSCVCGFYAYWSLGIVLGRRWGDIIGVIQGWGATVIGTRGFRCQRARIVAIAPSWTNRVNESLLELLGERYDCQTFPTTEAMVEGLPPYLPPTLSPPSKPVRSQRWYHHLQVKL